MPSRAIRLPSAGSRRSTRPTRSSAIPPSASSTTSSVRTGRRSARPARRERTARPFDGFGGGNVRYEFRTADAGEFSDFFRVFFGEGMGANGTRPTTGRGSPAPGGAMGFDDILAGMGIDLGERGPPAGTGPAAGTLRPAGTPPEPRSRLDPLQARATPAGPRGHRRDHPRRGLPRDDPPGRGRGQAPRDQDPEGCRERDPHQADRARTRWRRPHRRRPRAARRPIHPPRRGPRTRPPADPRGSAPRR